MKLSGTGGTGLALRAQAKLKSEEQGECSQAIGSGTLTKPL